MDKIIVKDLTWSAHVAEEKAKKQKGQCEEQNADENLVKSHRYWENRMRPCEKLDYLIRKFQSFLAYNPEYVQNGCFQIAVSATQDVGAYRIGANEYLEDVLVSLNPRRGLKFFVAMLNEARNCASSHRRCQRCLCSNTYYMRVDDKGNVHLDKLFENNDWLYAERVDYVLEQVIAINGGTLLDGDPKWYRVAIDGTKDFCRARYYMGADKVMRVAACFPNSGTILDEVAEELNLNDVVKRNGGVLDITNQLLRFRMVDDKVISRVNSSNPDYNPSLYS